MSLSTLASYPKGCMQTNMHLWLLKDNMTNVNFHIGILPKIDVCRKMSIDDFSKYNKTNVILNIDILPKKMCAKKYASTVFKAQHD